MSNNNNCPNACDCTVCNCDDCMDNNNMLITAGCTNTEVVFQNEYATVIRTESTTVEMFPYADGYQCSLVNEDADFCAMNEDGSLTFSETGNVMVG